MTLRDFLENSGRGALTSLAKKLKTSKGYLSDVSMGKSSCSVSFAKRIEEQTAGKVKASVVLGLESAQ